MISSHGSIRRAVCGSSTVNSGQYAVNMQSICSHRAVTVLSIYAASVLSIYTATVLSVHSHRAVNIQPPCCQYTQWRRTLEAVSIGVLVALPTKSNTGATIASKLSNSHSIFCKSQRALSFAACAHHGSSQCNTKQCTNTKQLHCLVFTVALLSAASQ